MLGRDQDDQPPRFMKFTERSRKVLSLAQEEAQRFNHHYIGTEHLLLGLVREGDGVAARVLTSLGVQLPRVRAAVEFIIARGDRIVLGDIGLTRGAKTAIELAVEESRLLGHHYVGTEHLLLGLMREGKGIAAGVLESLGLTLERVRTETIHVLSQKTPASEVAAPGDNMVTVSLNDQALDVIDLLVEAGITTTREAAAAWLIAAGIAVNRDLLTRITAKLDEARRLQAETPLASERGDEQERR